MSQDTLIQRLRIRQVIEDFVVWYDSGDFDRYETCWHADGVMNTTRGRMTATAFGDLARANWAKGAGVGTHMIGGVAIDVAGDRAIAQTKMVLSGRLLVDGIVCDTTCVARFYDFFARRDDRWAIVLRQPIYEKDRLDPVDPAASLALDAELLARFPEGYRHMAYAQTENGMAPPTDLPTLRGPEVDKLYARGKAWLHGGPAE